MIRQFGTYITKLFSPPVARRDRLCILIVEDSIVFREILKASLGDGYEVYIAANARQGWALHREKSPHIVFMDIGLPKGSGHDLARAIKQDDPSIYVVMATGSHDMADKVIAVRNHTDGFLVKPLQMKEINACVERYHALRRLRAYN